jgi:hypothetical protein
MKETIIEKDGKKYKVVEIKEALTDKNWFIRLEANRILGFTKDALTDLDEDIIREAKEYFRIQEALEKKNGKKTKNRELYRSKERG